MNVETSFVVLFSIATGVAIAVRRTSIPYTVALVIVGLAVGALHVMQVPHLTKDLLFALILPGLVFEAAFNLDARELSSTALSVGALAVPGVVVAIGLTAAIVAPMMNVLGLDPTFDWRYGLVFGALIAATDPIAVIALFNRLNVPRRLRVLIEAESLFNDGTAIVCFTLVLSFVAGGHASIGSLVAQFIGMVVGGAAIGGCFAVAATQVIKRVDEPMIEITLTVIAAYGSFALAEQLRCSGVIATVAAGMLCSRYGRQKGMSRTSRLAVDSFWDYTAFALNSIVFLLIGFEVRLGRLGAAWEEIIVAYLATMCVRFGVVAAVGGVRRAVHGSLSAGWVVAITWGGLRGALSIVLALSLPRDFPHRDQLVAMTFGVVLLTLLLQGLSISWLLAHLGITPPAGYLPGEQGNPQSHIGNG